jgi:hypothetical protein
MIVALQYYEGDRGQTMSLARLLADLEPVKRQDVMLALVCQPDTPWTVLTSKTIKHCERKFPVIHVVSARGDHGHPVACTAIWTGMMEFFHGAYQHEAVLALDGGDGVPLHRDWLSMMMLEHQRTLSVGKLITGSPYYLGGCPLHVNPNAVFQMSVWTKEPSLQTPPVYNGTLLTHFDIFHRRVMLANASLSSVVRTDWQGAGNKISQALMGERAKQAVWLHGYKDLDLFSVARQYLFAAPEVALALRRYDLPELYQQESLLRKRGG